jgi:hypothetical protein
VASGQERRCVVFPCGYEKTNFLSLAGRRKPRRPRNLRNSRWKWECAKKVGLVPLYFCSCRTDRSQGLEKLYTAAALYIRAMGKKKEGEDKEKTLPPEIFGQAMISHGGEYAPESAYGQALLKLGAGMERISRFQEVFPPNHQNSAEF